MAFLEWPIVRHANEVLAQFTPQPTSIAGGQEPAIARKANDFLNSMGVDTHIAQGIDRAQQVAASLTYTGIRNIRDDGSTNPAIIQAWLRVHSASGARVCLLPNGDIQRSIFEYEQLAAAGALLAAEGPNEPNNFPVTYNGQTSKYTTTFLPVAQFQRDLYAAVKGDPRLCRRQQLWLCQLHRRSKPARSRSSGAGGRTGDTAARIRIPGAHDRGSGVVRSG